MYKYSATGEFTNKSTKANCDCKKQIETFIGHKTVDWKKHLKPEINDLLVKQGGLLGVGSEEKPIDRNTKVGDLTLAQLMAALYVSKNAHYNERDVMTRDAINLAQQGQANQSNQQQGQANQSNQQQGQGQMSSNQQQGQGQMSSNQQQGQGQMASNQQQGQGQMATDSSQGQSQGMGNATSSR